MAKMCMQRKGAGRDLPKYDNESSIMLEVEIYIYTYVDNIRLQS